MTNPTNPYGDFDEDGMPRSKGKFANSSGAYSSGMPYSDPYPPQQPNVGQGYQDPSQHNFHNGYSNPYQSGYPNQQAPAYSAGFGGPNPHQGYGVAGSPVSDKSKIAAALLGYPRCSQLLPGAQLAWCYSTSTDGIRLDYGYPSGRILPNHRRQHLGIYRVHFDSRR